MVLNPSAKVLPHQFDSVVEIGRLFVDDDEALAPIEGVVAMLVRKLSLGLHRLPCSRGRGLVGSSRICLMN